MINREEIKKRHLESIELLKIDYQSKIEKFMEPRQSLIYETIFIDSFRIPEYKIPNEKSFSSKRKKIIITIFLSSISIMPFFANNINLKESFFASIFITLIFPLPVILHLWLSRKFRNKLKLTSTGIFHNNDFYNWCNILTSHVENIYNGEKEDEGYLLLGLDNGKFIHLDISNISYGSIFYHSEKELGHYIEVFKARWQISKPN